MLRKAQRRVAQLSLTNVEKLEVMDAEHLSFADALFDVVVANHVISAVPNPEAALDVLRAAEMRIDLFTFKQKLAHTSPEYGYPMEWDNVAALAVSTFDY